MKATRLTQQNILDKSSLSKKIQSKTKELKLLLDKAVDEDLTVTFNNIFFDADSFSGDSSDLVIVKQEVTF